MHLTYALAAGAPYGGSKILKKKIFVLTSCSDRLIYRILIKILKKNVAKDLLKFLIVG